MDLQKYYELLEPKNGEKILIIGEYSLPVALYIAGKMREQNKRISATALAPPGSIITSERIAMTKFKEESGVMERGVPDCTLTSGNFLSSTFRAKYNKIAFFQDILTLYEIKKLEEVLEGEKKVLFALSQKHFMPLSVETKGFLTKKTITISLKQFLIKMGFKVKYYDVEEKRLLCQADLIKLNKKMEKAILKISSPKEFSEKIFNELRGVLPKCAIGSIFAVRSSDDEYIYFTQVEKNEGLLKYKFIFLDGRCELEDIKSKAKNKGFKIIVLPHTTTFTKEIEEKEVLILLKSRIVDLFREHYAP